MELLTVLEHPERIIETERYRRISTLEAYFKGSQYDKRPDWYTGLGNDDQQVPLRERRPCIVTRLPAAAVRQVVRFTLGEGRFPKIEAVPTDEASAVAGVTISEAEAADLTRYIEALAKDCHLKSVAMQFMRTALAYSSAGAVASVRRGHFTWDMPRPQHCWPFFMHDDPMEDVEALVWCYPFNKIIEENGKLVERQHFFRRDYKPEEIAVYKDALAPPIFGTYVEWQRDEAKTKPNDLGFSPVVWVRHSPDPHCFDIDGAGLYEPHLEEFDGLSFALSQQHRTIHYHGSPQPYETGVDDDEQPGGIARQTRPVKGPNNQPEYGGVMAGPFGVNPKPARKMSPDSIWSYRGKAMLGMLETSGKAFEIGEKHAKNIRARVLEAMSIVMVDPDTAAKQDITGIALQRLFAPMLALVDELREYYWEHALAKMIGVMLRITAQLNGVGILVPGAVRAAAILKRFFVPFEGETLWVAPQMTPTWGDYFSPSPDEIKAAVESANAAVDGKLITAETGTRYVAPYFGVESAEDEAEDVVEEAQAKDDANKETLHAAQKTLMTGMEQKPMAPAEPAAEPAEPAEPPEAE